MDWEVVINEAKKHTIISIMLPDTILSFLIKQETSKLDRKVDTQFL